MMIAQDNCWGFMGGVMDGFFNTRTGWIDPEWITNMMPAATLSEDELPNKISINKNEKYLNDLIIIISLIYYSNEFSSRLFIQVFKM